LALARCYLAGACREDGSVWALGGGSSLWQHAATYRSTELLLPYDDGRSDGDGGAAAAGNGAADDDGDGDGDGAWETDDDDDDDDDKDDGDTATATRGSVSGAAFPCARAWRAGPEMTAARCGHGAAVAHERGGALFAVGGYGGGLSYHTSAEVGARLTLGRKRF
jgi:hypothetical protein